MGNDLFFFQRHTLPEHHICFRRLTPVFIGHTDGAGLQDLGMFEEDLVDLLWKDIVPACHNQIFFPVHDCQVTVIIQETDVSGKEPPVFEHSCGLIGLLVVSFHDLRPAKGNLSRLTKGHLF